MTVARQPVVEACAAVGDPVLFWQRLGGALLITATGAMATAGLVLATPTSLPLWLNQVAGGLLVAAAAAALVRRNARPVWIVCAIFWIYLGRSDLTGFGRLPITLASLVPFAAAATLILTATRLCCPLDRKLRTALDTGAAAMLVLFGAVHVQNAADVVAIVPTWMPWRHVVPYLTGPLLIAAGAATASRVRLAVGAVAVMFAAWLPLVHVPRLLASPMAWGEWRFALTALALVGALIITQAGANREAA